MFAVIALAALLAISVATVAVLLLQRSGSTPAPTASAVDPAIAQLWSGFIDSPEHPWVVFSNAQFSGRPETNLHYFRVGVDDPKLVFDHYTGVGEVLAIHELDRLFNDLHHGLRVKRGLLLSLDDAKNNDLIFVGSPSENLSLLDIPTMREFTFKRMTDGPRKPDLYIANAQPRPGEQAAYLNNGRPLVEDYAVVGLMPGLNPARWVMVLAGITTMGTQAAVEYVCRPAGAGEILRRLRAAGQSGVSPFEAVLRVKVSHGVPVESEMMAFHARR